MQTRKLSEKMSYPKVWLYRPYALWILPKIYTELTVGQQRNKLTPMSRELSTWTETYDALMPFTQLIVMLFVLFLSSSPDSQNVSVEPSVRLPIMAGRLDVLMSTTLVRSFRQVTTQSSCNTCKMYTLIAVKAYLAKSFRQMHLCKSNRK